MNRYAGHGKSHDLKGADPVQGIVPIGGIILWSGAVAKIPFGWQLCNGTNGTPDLRNSFVVGAGDTYAVGATGGSAAQADHTGHGAHGEHDEHSNAVAGENGALERVFNSSTAAQHSAHANNGAISAHGTNLPPYYALAYIQRML